MTSAENVLGSPKELKILQTKDDAPKSNNEFIHEEHRQLIAIKDQEDVVILDLVNEFVQEILRRGIAKYHEDMKNSRETKVKVSMVKYQDGTKTQR
jgi:DNA-directed RNA polymerase specialized sigma54-like protein